MEIELKIFRRVLVANAIVVGTACLLIFLPPSVAPWDSFAFRDFLVRFGWILAMPLALGLITYPNAVRYRSGMGRP
jgi:hypothetical protein